MAHAKAVNRKKNNEDDYDSPHHTPITGDRREDYEDSAIPLPKKKKKIKPPTSLNSSINDENTEESGTSGSSGRDSDQSKKIPFYQTIYINRKIIRLSSN